MKRHYKLAVLFLVALALVLVPNIASLQAASTPKSRSITLCRGQRVGQRHNGAPSPRLYANITSTAARRRGEQARRERRYKDESRPFRRDPYTIIGGLGADQHATRY